MANFKIEIPLVAVAGDVNTLVREFYDPSVTPPELVNTASRSFLFLRDENGLIRGGAYCEFLYDVCSINGLWVSKELRGHRHGARIYQAVEDLAYIKGRKRVVLSAFEFQNSIPFWEKMGFTKFAELPGYPEGSRLFYMHKAVTDKPFSTANK